MSINRFKVTAEKILGTTLEIKLEIVDPEQERFYTQRNFALQLIWHVKKIESHHDGPLYKAITYQQISDKDWVYKNQKRFIEEMKILSYINYPFEEKLAKMTDEELKKYWEQEKDLPQAKAYIRVSEEKWIAHISEGLTWYTAAKDFDFI